MRTNFNPETSGQYSIPRLRDSFQHFLIVAILLFSTFATNAQCAMCRAAIESEGNTVKAEAVNDGIVYLMVIPYLLVGAIGFAVYRMNKAKKE